MFLAGLIIGLLATVLVMLGFFGMSLGQVIAAVTSSYLFAGIPAFLLVFLLEFFLIINIFKIDRIRKDLPPALINRRFFSSILILFAGVLVIVFADRIAQLIIMKKPLGALFSGISLRCLLLCAPFIILAGIAFFTFISCFIFHRSKFSEFIKNKIPAMIIAVLFIAAAFVLRWELGSNTVESITNSFIRSRYFTANYERVPEGKLRSLFSLRAAQCLYLNGIAENQKSEAQKALFFLDKIKSEKMKGSFEYTATRLSTNLFLGNEPEAVDDYFKIFGLYKKIPVRIFREFVHNALAFSDPPFTRIITAFDEHPDFISKEGDLKGTYDFLKSNIENDTAGLKKFYNAMSIGELPRRIALFKEIISDTRPFLIKDDAHIEYINFLIEKYMKREAFRELKEFLVKYPESGYLKDIAEYKNRIRFSFLGTERAEKTEMYNLVKNIDGKSYVFTNRALYEFDPETLALTLAFKYNDDDGFLARVIPFDKYFWLFYKGGRVEVLNLVIRDKKIILQPSGNMSYVSPYAHSGSNMYLGTQGGLFIYTADGKKIKMVSKAEGLSSQDISFVDLSGDLIFLGTDKSFAVYNSKSSDVVMEKGYRDLITQQNFSFYKFVDKCPAGIYALADLGFVRYNEAAKIWDPPVSTGHLSAVHFNDETLVFILRKDGKSVLYIFSRKNGALRTLEDLPLPAPFIFLKIIGNDAYMVNMEKKIACVHLKDQSSELLKVSEDAGDILDIEVMNGYIFITRTGGIDLIDLEVK